MYPQSRKVSLAKYRRVYGGVERAADFGICAGFTPFELPSFLDECLTYAGTNHTSQSNDSHVPHAVRGGDK